MQPIDNVVMVRLIEEAVDNVFSMMLGLPIQRRPALQDTGDPSCVDGVVALVGIGGTWTGSGRVYCSSEFACRIAGCLLGNEFARVNDEVMDAIAEIANMIIGHVKSDLEEQVGPLGLSIPTVIFGQRYHARSARSQNSIVVPFASGSDSLEVRFCLVPVAGSGRRSQLNQSEPALA